jgi:hypothetical protein
MQRRTEDGDCEWKVQRSEREEISIPQVLRGEEEVEEEGLLIDV